MHRHGEVVAGDRDCRKVNFDVTQDERMFLETIETIEDLKRMLKEETRRSKPNRKSSEYRGVNWYAPGKKWVAAIWVRIYPCTYIHIHTHTHIYMYILRRH